MAAGKFEIGRFYTFSASHRLLTLPDDHQCFRMHGHNYKVEVVLEGSHTDNHGMLLDFARLDLAVKPFIEELDHRHLNDVLHTKIPTAELVAQRIYEHVKVKLPEVDRPFRPETPIIDVARVIVWETERSWGAYLGSYRS